MSLDLHPIAVLLASKSTPHLGSLTPSSFAGTWP